MKPLFHIFYKLRGSFLENAAESETAKLKDGEYRLHFKIPYVSQYASAERAEEFINNENLLNIDLRWRESGAVNLEEYVFWAPKLCGMACFSMVLLSLGRPTSKLVELGKRAMAVGCYLPDQKNSKRLIGLLHKPFLKFAKGLGLNGKLLWYIGPNVVAGEILKGNFVIASVHRDIRRRGANPKSKTGHLILIHGFKISEGVLGGFYIHNPSGFYGISQENYFVPAEDFINCFSGRIIALYKA